MSPYEAIAHTLSPGARLLGRWPLAGGVSASVEAIEIALPDGRTSRFVVRRHGAAAWKPLEADVTRTEHDLLAALFAAGLEVPRPVLVDVSGEVLPSPYLVMEHVEGTTAMEPGDLGAVRQMAAWLARLHGFPPDRLALPSLPARADPVPELLQYLPETGELAEVRRWLASGITIEPPARTSLVHGDFWPGNVLWQGGRIAAVIDWEDAAIGDPLSDVATCRLELLWKHGEDASEAFASRYLELTGVDTRRLPLWELLAASGALAFMASWGLAADVEARMREGAERFRLAAARRLLAG